MTRNVYLDLSYALTDETIQATRKWFADEAQHNILDVLNGTIMPSWPSRYVAHQERCICEDVRIEEIHGDLSDLIGSPILQAECVSFEDNTPDESGRVGEDALYAWTFYKLATIKGYVTIRWLGESNGYYGVEVDFSWREQNQ